MGKITLPIPDVIYTSDKACAEYIVGLNERLAKISEIEKAVKEAKEIACNHLLNRLELSGLKNFNFEGIGQFKKSSTLHKSFPSVEDGGKPIAVAWLEKAYNAGAISFSDVMNVQQSRLSNDAVVSLEQVITEWNEENPNQSIGDSPFGEFEKVTLTTPRKFKE